MIGSLGDVVFEVSSESVRTFSDMSMNRQAKYASHDIIGGKSLLEFTGLTPLAISLKISLSTSLGITPSDELDVLRKMLDEHEAVTFALNGIPQGDGKWVVESLSEAHEIIDNKGVARLVNVTVAIKEYV